MNGNWPPTVNKSTVTFRRWVNLVITPPAKAGGFLRSVLRQQRLLRLRMSHSTTLACEGSIRAYLLYSKRFKSYVANFSQQPLNLKLLKCAGREDDTEAMILLIPPKSNCKVYPGKESGANSSVVSKRQSPLRNYLCTTSL